MSIFAEESLPARAFAGNPIALRAVGAGARRHQSMTRSLLPAFRVRATLLEAALCGAVLGLPVASAMAAEWPAAVKPL